MEQSQSHFSDIAGQQFGSWTVLPREKRRGHLWLCQCKCGNESYVSSTNLRKGRSRGCLACLSQRIGSGDKHPKWTGCGAISGFFWSKLKESAKRRHILLDLSIQEAWELFEDQHGRCAISNLELRFDKDLKRQTASLDRIDSSHGYIPGNIQWVHKSVNLMKGTLTNQEFLGWCARIIEHSLERAENG